MKRYILFLVAGLIVIGSAAAAGDLDHLYVPYGYDYPLLSQGEYVLTGSFAQHDTWQTHYYHDTGDTAWGDEDPLRRISLEGLYAVFGNLYLRGGLSYEFAQDSHSWSTQGYDSHRHENAVWEPSVNVVYRPWTQLQVSASYSRYTRTTSSRSEYTIISPMTDSSSDEFTAQGYSVRVSWSGKL